MTEKDEEDEDGISFATLESRFENKARNRLKLVNYKSVVLCKTQ